MKRAAPAILAVAASLSGCASTLPRAAPSSHGCMAAVRDALPADDSDPRRHCLAAGGIVLRCSSTEALMASWGKEVQDFFGRGDASREDLEADAAGRKCAGSAKDEAALAQCCTAAGY